MNRQPTPSILDDVLTTDASRPTAIRNASIKVDGGTQMRAQLDPATVQEYADTMAKAGWGKFPPIIAYYDGSDYWLADGFHRLSAWRSIANWSDAMIPADVRSGTRRDAILHAAGANASHGLRRTNADKRRAVETLLRDEEWAKWSNMEIARRCNVDEGTVRKVRKDLESASEIPKVTERHGADGKTYATANIGAKSGPVPQPIPAPTAKEYSAAVPARFTLSSDDLPADLIAAGWTVRSKDLGSYWVVNETNGMETAVVRNWDGFTELCATLQKRLPSHAEAMASAISNQQSPISNSPTPATPRQFAAAVKSATWTGTQPDILPPTNAPLPAWADEPAPRPSPLAPPDDRLQPAQRLRALYQAVIDSDDEYGALTGRFSDTLAVKRDLSAMIGHLDFLINAITHPEEVSE